MFIQLLLQAQHEMPFQLHAYCLMTNHFHLLLQTINHSLSKTVQYFMSRFAKFLNRRTNHVGHVFQGRFHSIPVNTDSYFTTVSRYIHLNPVRAGIVQHAEDFPWSNYGRLIRGEPDPLVDPKFLLDYFGNDSAIQRQKYYRFVEEGMRKAESINDKVLLRMRFWGVPMSQETRYI